MIKGNASKYNNEDSRIRVCIDGMESQRNSRMKNHDLIKDRWIKRTRGERSEHHKDSSQSFTYRDLE
jgi:hypothetical protein